MSLSYALLLSLCSSFLFHETRLCLDPIKSVSTRNYFHITEFISNGHGLNIRRIFVETSRYRGTLCFLKDSHYPWNIIFTACAFIKTSTRRRGFFSVLFRRGRSCPLKKQPHGATPYRSKVRFGSSEFSSTKRRDMFRTIS